MAITGFLQKYLDKNKLAEMAPSVIKNLAELEKELSSQTQESSNSSFEEVMKDYGPAIADLISRISARLKDVKLSFPSVWNTLKFVIDISKEVYQMVEGVQAKLIPAGTAPDVAETKKVAFGIDLVYFIWKTIDPLKEKFGWVPFKATLEKWLVRKLALAGIQHAISFFKTNPQLLPFNQVKVASVDNPAILKAL